MSAARDIPQAVLGRQIAAADPERSVWVSANAGSGKTHVLAQRVISLLLRGTAPEKILCLTYTKAAAANMANRVFDTLARVDRARRRRARRRRSRRAPASRRTPTQRAARAPAVRDGAGDAGRAEGADHPRLLHAAAAPVSVRGRCRGALRGAGRRARQSQLLERADARRAAGGRRRSGQRARPRARRPRSPRRPTSPSRR